MWPRRKPAGFRERTTAQGLPASERGQDTNSGRSDSAVDAGCSGWEMLKCSEMPKAAGVVPTQEKAEGAGVAGVWTPSFHLVSAVLPAQLKTSGIPRPPPSAPWNDQDLGCVGRIHTHCPGPGRSPHSSGEPECAPPQKQIPAACPAQRTKVTRRDPPSGPRIIHPQASPSPPPIPCPCKSSQPLCSSPASSPAPEVILDSSSTLVTTDCPVPHRLSLRYLSSTPIPGPRAAPQCHHPSPGHVSSLCRRPHSAPGALSLPPSPPGPPPHLLEQHFLFFAQMVFYYRRASNLKNQYTFQGKH